MEELTSIILWIGIIYYFIKKRKSKNDYKDYINIENNEEKNEEINKENKNLIPCFDKKYYISNNKYKDIYYKNKYLITENEIRFYRILKIISIKMDYNLFCQVSLYQIVKPINNKNYTDFNKIRSKSIDFVLTDNNFKTVLCIELDDNSHKRIDRIERDNFINELFKDLEIKLLRIPVQDYYNEETITRKIKESLLK